jgi:hypothetical protein
MLYLRPLDLSVDETMEEIAAAVKVIGATRVVIDSLMGLELRNRLESALGLRLSATLVWSYGDAEALAGHLAARFDVAAQPPAAPSVPSPERTDAPNDVERRLEEKLAALRERIQ